MILWTTRKGFPRILCSFQYLQIKEDPTLAQRYHAEMEGTETSVSIKEDSNDTLGSKSNEEKVLCVFNCYLLY